MTEDARMRQDAGRNRRYSDDRAKRRWYAYWRSVRFSSHYGGVIVVDALVSFRKSH